jgi:homoserine O-succinyltransferase/O-acetyltransferase
MPHGYFDHETVEALTALRQRALLDRREELLADFPTAMAAGKVKNTWRTTAENLYRNWLLYIRTQKEQRLEQSRVEATVSG